MSNPIRFVSTTCLKLVDLVAEGKIKAIDAYELIDTMKENGFAENHDKFFDGVKALIQKILKEKYPES